MCRSVPHTPQAPILMSAAFFGTSGQGTERITGSQPGPSNVETRICSIARPLAMGGLFRIAPQRVRDIFRQGGTRGIHHNGEKIVIANDAEEIDDALLAEFGDGAAPGCV